MSISPEEWLQSVQALHPRDIALGLERPAAVWQRLWPQGRIAAQVVLVAGTNGKGSTCASLEALSLAAGLRTATYTSPHLLRFAERLRIDGSEFSNADWVEALEAVAGARGSTALTWFEHVTLAAFWLIAHGGVERAILEIGLGGRLDVVNLIAPDCCVITTIGFDHQAFLGDTLEQIAFEKAGILRSGVPVVLGSRELPAVIHQRAAALAAPVWQLGRDFDHLPGSGPGLWNWQSKGAGQRSISGLKRPSFPLDNAAAAIQTALCLGDSLTDEALVTALGNVAVPGRCQRIAADYPLVADVAHNPQAAGWLAEALAAIDSRPWLLVWSSLADKDIPGVLAALRPVIGALLVFQLDVPRAASREQLQASLEICPASLHESFEQAFRQARSMLQQAPEAYAGIVMTGSFHVVELAFTRMPWKDGSE